MFNLKRALGGINVIHVPHVATWCVESDLAIRIRLVGGVIFAMASVTIEYPERRQHSPLAVDGDHEGSACLLILVYGRSYPLGACASDDAVFSARKEIDKSLVSVKQSCDFSAIDVLTDKLNTCLGILPPCVRDLLGDGLLQDGVAAAFERPLHPLREAIRAVASTWVMQVRKCLWIFAVRGLVQ